MRRLVVLGILVAALVMLALSNGVAASPVRARVSSTVRLLVLRTRGGAVLAAAPVTIHGRRFPFLIDTGATKSVVDFALARQLGLRRVGRPVRVGGVGCVSTAYGVRLSHWRVGSQRLPPITVWSARLGGANGSAIGLLGSDVLSRFGSVAIDYAHGRLTLG